MTTETPAVNYKIGNERLIRITEKAARKLESLLEEKGKPEGALRLAVVGGGCSGLQYVMDLVDGPKERDILVPISNVRLVIDPKSALFVSGSVLDYSEDLQKGGFKVTNPNAVAHCSCGESFAVYRNRRRSDTDPSWSLRMDSIRSRTRFSMCWDQQSNSWFCHPSARVIIA